MIIADENLHVLFIRTLVSRGHKVVTVSSQRRGAPDEQVIEMAQDADAILITEDKDFGELVFAHQMTNVTVVFLRYRLVELPVIAQVLVRVIEDLQLKDGCFFVVVTSTRIRIRSI